MSNQLSHILKQWHDNKDDCAWVLGTIYDHCGPCYRKAGAMMLFNSLGQQFGMLSGGCLESDIAKKAQKVMTTGKTIKLCYDGSDEDDMAFQLGIGCGGTVHIMLQSINFENNYLALDKVFNCLLQRKTGVYSQKISHELSDDQARFNQQVLSLKNSKTKLNHLDYNSQNDTWLETPIIPEPHILIAGGGLDARPMVEIAHQLGWHISLWDPRPANARREFFLKANQIIKGDVNALSKYVNQSQIDAAVVMTHNINLDAKSLFALSNSSIRYLALLGPTHRKFQVLQQANLDELSLNFPIAGPAGLNIGAQLPESIALSILSECHASLYAKPASSISNVLVPSSQIDDLKKSA
ncbi:isoquinoline 1-oxidoreductase [Pseudoalteromonas sp. NBT06-2]|uniref:XdhC family protein n=1 Tax=Pseudoalteromonas sp. NBT06-2 TaxID=2025950 RepID=UPI000BA7D706|nr:XdhC/CoxI family protein [Pseudoalteromonas sp. NBT06-2]PAJ74043.1 isoquinoline 1-oxidoreductase [Pseudoalteromonas sp. NBT06-2]